MSKRSIYNTYKIKIESDTKFDFHNVLIRSKRTILMRNGYVLMLQMDIWKSLCAGRAEYKKLITHLNTYPQSHTESTYFYKNDNSHQLSQGFMVYSV